MGNNKFILDGYGIDFIVEYGKKYVQLQTEEKKEFTAAVILDFIEDIDPQQYSDGLSTNDLLDKEIEEVFDDIGYTKQLLAYMLAWGPRYVKSPLYMIKHSYKNRLHHKADFNDSDVINVVVAYMNYIAEDNKIDKYFTYDDFVAGKQEKRSVKQKKLF